MTDTKQPNTYLRNERGRKMHTHELYLALGLSRTAHLPAEGLGDTMIGNVKVWVLSKAAARAVAATLHRPFVHRVMCECPDCGQKMSAGRLHQHHLMIKRDPRTREVVKVFGCPGKEG